MFVEHKEAGEVLRDREPNESALDEASKLLLKAADLIDRVGLSCGGMRDQFGRPCTVIAIASLQACFIVEDTALNMIRAYIRPRIGHDGIGLWSDNTPQDEVVATLRAVALGG